MMKDKMHFLIDNHLPHDSSAASAASVSAGVSPPSSSSSPPLYSLPLPPTQHFSPSPTPIPTDGPTVELPRRRRGRPPGSKNRPKNKPHSSPSSPTSPSPSPSPIPLPPSLRTHLLLVDPNRDIVESLTHFCRTRSVSLSILSASGSLSHFVLRHPSSPSSNLAFRGRFEILSISATVIDSIDSRPTPSPSPYFPSRFTVTVTGPQGQVIGGAVSGPLVTAGPVFIAAASFDKPTYHRLPEMDEEEDDNNDVVDGEGNKSQQTGLTGGGGIFTRNLSGSDAVWGPPVVPRPPY